VNILITSIGQKVNLIKYFRRALFNEGGGKILGFDTNPLVNSRSFIDLFLHSPSVNEQSFRDWLIAKVEQHKIQLIVPSRDEDLRALVDLKALLQEKYSCRILVPARNVLSICQNKELFSNWCLNNGFQSPKNHLLSQVSEDSLPLFVKPKIGAGSEGVMLIDSWDQWLEVSKDLDDSYLIQEYICAPEYTVDLFVDRHNNVLSVVPRIRQSIFKGESVRAKVELDAEIINQSIQLAQELSLESHNTIQCFKTKLGVVFSEVNTRFGGGFSLGVESGADTPRFLIREQKELKPLISDVAISDGLEMLRVQKDIIFSSRGLKVFCFDLDGTICTESCAYEDAQPMPFIVAKINQLYDDGHTIIISTARGASSKKSWRNLIINQLQQWGVQYHELITDKPYADYYIDNKAVDILEFF
jgi:carbamoyl-phosphate synthase large subunit